MKMTTSQYSYMRNFFCNCAKCEKCIVIVDGKRIFICDYRKRCFRAKVNGHVYILDEFFKNIPQSIISRQAKLNPVEWEQIKQFFKRGVSLK